MTATRTARPMIFHEVRPMTLHDGDRSVPKADRSAYVLSTRFANDRRTVRSTYRSLRTAGLRPIQARHTIIRLSIALSA